MAEICDAGRPDAVEDEEGGEPEPLSASPYFSVVLGPTQVHPFSRPFTVPRRFLEKMPEGKTKVLLRLHHPRQQHSSKRWEVTYTGNGTSRKFAGWRNFAEDNGLRAGDACVFQMEEGELLLQFAVRVLRGDIPSKYRSAGDSSQRPIQID